MSTTNGIKLFPYQKEGVIAIENFGGRVLLSDSMGMGKTIQVLVALRRNPSWLPALIVCPSSVKYNWEIEAHRLGMQSSICEGEKPPIYNGRDFNTLSPLTIINYDILKHWVKYLKKLKLKSIVLDEGQYLGNPRAQRTRAARELSQRSSQVMVLSGTPLTNRPAELWSLLNILWPDQFESFWSYAQDHCNPKYRPWGWDFSGSSNLPQLHDRLRQLGMIRRRKEDVLKDLPDKIRRIVPCQLSDEKEYKEASTDFLSWLRKNYGHKVGTVSKVEKLARVGYLLRLIAKLKLRSVVDWANRFLEETDEKLILFAVHKKCIDVLERRIHAQSVTVDGSVTGRKRQVAVDQFQNDKKTRVFIGNIKAAGVGITLTAASEVGFVEFWWNPGTHAQAEDRPHRIGQKKTVWANYFVATGTIEHDLCKLLQKRQAVISTVLDGGTMQTDLNLWDELVQVLEQGTKP